jgi:hypothetical protein
LEVLYRTVRIRPTDAKLAAGWFPRTPGGTPGDLGCFLDIADPHKETVSSAYDVFRPSLLTLYGLARYYWDVHEEFSQSPGVVFAILAFVMAAAVLAWAPWYLGLSATVGLAVAWCIWLERHPPS